MRKDVEFLVLRVSFPSTLIGDGVVLDVSDVGSSDRTTTPATPATPELIVEMFGADKVFVFVFKYWMELHPLANNKGLADLANKYLNGVSRAPGDRCTFVMSILAKIFAQKPQAAGFVIEGCRNSPSDSVTVCELFCLLHTPTPPKQNLGGIVECPCSSGVSRSNECHEHCLSVCLSLQRYKQTTEGSW
jgi:hypothetical protein